MGKHHSSGNSDRNPYQRADKLVRFWHETEGRIWGYSQATKDYFDERARLFILANTNAKRTNWIKR